MADALLNTGLHARPRRPHAIMAASRLSRSSKSNEAPAITTPINQVPAERLCFGVCLSSTSKVGYDSYVERPGWQGVGGTNLRRAAQSYVRAVSAVIDRWPRSDLRCRSHTHARSALSEFAQTINPRRNPGSCRRNGSSPDKYPITRQSDKFIGYSNWGDRNNSTAIHL